MTFLVLNTVFVGVSLVVFLAARLRRGRDAGRAPSVPAVLLSLVVLCVMTAVFDNLMIAAGLFDYADSRRLGVLIGRAPIEDFAYPAAGALLLPALWHLLPGRERGAGRHRGGQSERGS